MFGAFLLFGFWFLGISLPFVLFWVWFPAAEVWAHLVTLVWAHRHLLLTVQARMGSASSKVPPQPGRPLGKILNDWSTYSYDPMTKKNGLKMDLLQLDLYCHRMGKWTEVPLCPGLSPIIESLRNQKNSPVSGGKTSLPHFCKFPYSFGLFW